VGQISVFVLTTYSHFKQENRKKNFSRAIAAFSELAALANVAGVAAITRLTRGGHRIFLLRRERAKIVSSVGFIIKDQYGNRCACYINKYSMTVKHVSFFFFAHTICRQFDLSFPFGFFRRLDIISCAFE